MPNIFNEIMSEYQSYDFKLGLPSMDIGHNARRLALMERLTGGNGFRTPAKEQKVRANGKTRGQMKREARAAANAKVSEKRDIKFQHRGERVRNFQESLRAAA